MIRRAILLLTCLAITRASGQSPLSELGWGREVFFSSPGLGPGLLVIGDTLFPHPQFPPSWGDSRQMRIAFQWVGTNISVQDSTGKDRSGYFNWRSLVSTLPISPRMTLGLSVIPLTRSSSRRELAGEIGDSVFIKVSQRSGGLSQTILGVGIALQPNFTLGLGVRGLTGKIEDRLNVRFPTRPSQWGEWWGDAEATYSERVEGWSGHLSARWSAPQWSIGAWISPPLEMETERQVVIKRSGKVIADTTIKHFGQAQFPLQWALALGVRQGEHQWGMEGEFHHWGAVSPRKRYERFSDSYRLVVGWSFIPTFNPLDPFYHNWSWRGGLSYYKHYVSLNEDPPRELSGEFGSGIPLVKGRIRLNWGIRWSQTSTLHPGSLKETWWEYSITLLYKETWLERPRPR